MDHEVAEHLGRLRLGHARSRQGKTGCRVPSSSHVWMASFARRLPTLRFPSGEQPRHLDRG
jgi:hypothetical protein